MKILKFGGKSLANGIGITNAINIVKHHTKKGDKLGIVLSARGNTTDELLEFLDLAKNNISYTAKFNEFINYQIEPYININIEDELSLISRLLEGIKLLSNYTPKEKKLLLAQGEILSVKLFVQLLKNENINALAIDTRTFIKTDDLDGKDEVIFDKSEQLFLKNYGKIKSNVTPVFTGFIASNLANETTTLGRNGSNYTASILANFMNVEEVLSYTHLNGIYTANPELVTNAKHIKELSYAEANELANFGVNILHSNTISPLSVKNIPLTIKNTFKPKEVYTKIHSKAKSKGIKSITSQDNVYLLVLKGEGLIKQVGLDARIFSILAKENINVNFVSQGASERIVSFIVEQEDGLKAKSILEKELKDLLEKKDLEEVLGVENISLLSIIGQKIEDFSTSLSYLKENNIDVLLINNAFEGKNISIVVYTENKTKALNIIHSQIFGINKRIHIAVIGKGTVGAPFIQQLLSAKKEIEKNKGIELIIFAVSGKNKVLLNRKGLTKSWKPEYDKTFDSENVITSIIEYAKTNHLENLIFVDNTASLSIAKSYPNMVANGFDIVSSNKIANTLPYSEYIELRKNLKQKEKTYLYETNVGAGLPIIDTIKLLHQSGENITQIRGVFSGSLSYLFNAFSSEEKPFSYFLQKAIDAGFTEPDPREDLSGGDVARKLLILARELSLANEIEEVEVENLIPLELRTKSKSDFLNQLNIIDEDFEKRKKKLKENEVLRYVAVLGGDLSQEKAKLSVKLESVCKNTKVGSLTGTDSLIEIYTESYGEQPITIIGAGAGDKVTARGVLGDVLRIADKK